MTEPNIFAGLPVPGCFLWRKKRRGRRIPARIARGPMRDPTDRTNWMDRGDYWSAWLDGELAAGPDLTVPPLVWWIAMSGRRIGAREYIRRVRRARWDAKWNPRALDPDAVDLATSPTIF